MSLTDQQKFEFARFMLPYCPFVHVDYKIPGVELPESLQRDGLVLRIGEDPRVLGMPDLVMNELGWSATLSVNGSRVFVTIPWAAIDRMWVGDPFEGPLVLWPQALVALSEEQQSEPATTGLVSIEKAGLRLVKKSPA